MHSVREGVKAILLRNAELHTKIFHQLNITQNTLSASYYKPNKNKGTKGILLRQFLIPESPLKMMKNAFYFTLKDLFILKIFKFFS